MHSRIFSTALLLACFGIPLSAFGDEATEKQDEKTLIEAGVGADNPALLRFFKDRTLAPADQARLLETVRRLGHDRQAARDKASLDLIAAGRPARSFLRQALNDPDLEIAHRAGHCLRVLDSSSAVSLELAVARMLAVRKPEGSAAIALGYLPFVDDDLMEEELVGVVVATGVREGWANPVIMQALGDGSAIKRSAAALAAGRSRQPEQRAKVKTLLLDKEPKVRLRAALGLLGGREKDAVPALMLLLSNSPREVAWQAEEVLCRLAGDQSPQLSVGAGTDADRTKCREAWEAWWRVRAAGTDLAKIELEQRSLGLTLFVAFDGYGNQGKVWEARADGKPRWEIRDVQGPIDAQVLPGNRVLIAEHNARRISERDLTGKVLWEYSLANGNQFPVSCQRLPNGNTFVATYNQVLEITPDRKEVYNHPCTSGIIYSAQKLRNGHIAYVTSTGMLQVVDGKGKQIQSVKLGPVAGWVTVEALPGGRFLVPQANQNKVIEVDSTGRTVATYTTANANAASKLPNGNILICRQNGRSVVEVDRAGKEVIVHRLEGRPFWAKRR